MSDSAAAPKLGNGESRAFYDLIETTAANHEKDNSKLIAQITSQPESRLPLLVRAAEAGEDHTRRFIGDLFKNDLKKYALHSLLPLISGDNPDHFAWAAGILADLHEPEALPYFKKNLSSPHKTRALAAARALAMYSGPESLQSLSEFFLSSTDWVFLSAIMRYLAPRSADLAPDFLKRYPSLTDDQKAWVLKFLAEAADLQALNLFVQVLEKDPLKLGLFCIHGLGKIGNRDAVEALAKVLDKNEWFIRKRIVNALGNAKCPEVVPPLVKMLSDPSTQVRASAIESLSRTGHLDLELLISQLEKGAHEVRVCLIKVLGQIHDIRVVEPLVKTLSDRSTLFFSIDALGDLGFPEAAQALEALIADPEWFNRLNALEALGKMHLPHVRKVAERCLEDSNDMVRNAATRILANTTP